MHHCLYISEVLNLIFKFAGHRDVQHHQGRQEGKKTLASLARTCRLFSSPALDALWHDLYSFDPLINISPIATSFVDDSQWSTFRKYARRVKTFRPHGARVPVKVEKEFISSLQHCPISYLPLLPNVAELKWGELSYSALDDSGVPLLKYFAGPAVTSVTLSLLRWLAYSSPELAIITDLPTLCPNVTSFTVVVGFPWEYQPCRELGRMVAQWPRLQTLRTCVLPQSMMDQLFSRRTLQSGLPQLLAQLHR
ncbi:hypothetical protein HD554DRAFT_1266538 [Boletus coccyginus]|nr:hypothetical protein HD554DRAFT_1266538 [Boletus coccyginus]